MEVKLQAFTSALDGGEWSASRHPGRWVGPRAGLEAMAKKKYPSPAGNRTLVAQPVA
jgi:hypothetical protein